MRKFTFIKMLPLVLAAAFFPCGCVVPPGAPVASVGAEVEVASAPPLDLVETVPPCPGPGFVWIGGAWAWNGRWVWQRGHWDRPPHPGAVWVPHRYVYRNGRHTFVRGGWK